LTFLNNLNRGLVLIYGSAATGKTTWGLQKSLEISKKGKVLFLDTENTFSTERIKQMDKNYIKYLDNIFIVKPKSFDELNKKIEMFKEISNKFDLIVLDSFGMFYRLDLKKRGHIETNKIAVKILRNLRNIAERIPVIITNQVYDKGEGKQVLGGKMIQNFSDYIIELETNPRLIKILKPELKNIEFNITNEGFVISS
jgi:RecA/RadA recombinase